VNTAWTLVAAFLVFGMQVGFTMLEAGCSPSTQLEPFGYQQSSDSLPQ
jgi:ammonia channel protein AmtB